MAKPQYGAAHQARRKAWALELARLGSRPCACTGQCHNHHGPCPTILHPQDPWDLGHGTAHHHGGTGTDSQPQCTNCNRTEGAHIRNHTTTTPASDDWW